MKTKPFNTRAGVAVAALVASIGLSTSAKAILFQNLVTPPGDQFVFKLADFDNGTLYDNLAPGSYGFGQNGTGPQTVAGGVGTLDAGTLAGNQAVGFHTWDGLLGDKKEDSWGIAQVTEIRLASNNAVIWQSFNSPGNPGDNQQLTIMFYGEQDYYTRVAGAQQTTAGVGLTVDLWLQDVGVGFTPIVPTPGLRPANADSNGGAAGDPFLLSLDASYPTVTDGTRVLSLRSTSGFIRADGDLGGLATEFETTFNGTALNGSGLGTSYLDVVGGTLASRYDTNTLTSFIPGAIGKKTDISIQFTSTTAGTTGLGDWLVTSQDPLRAVAVPEPTTVLAGLGCMAPILSSLLGRRRKNA